MRIKIPFTKAWYISITQDIGDLYRNDKYLLPEPLKNRMAKSMLEGEKIPPIKALREHGQLYGHSWGLKEAKDYVEENFKYIPYYEQPGYVDPLEKSINDYTNETNDREEDDEDDVPFEDVDDFKIIK